MGRTLFVVVTDDHNLVQKARSFGHENNINVTVFTSQQWSEGLQNPAFRAQVATEEVVLNGGSQDAKVYPFPGRADLGKKRTSTINDLESEAIQKAIVDFKGNLTEAARALGIGRATIYRKIKQYNIDPNLGRPGQKAA